MKTLKKTLFAGLAMATLATAGASITTSQAEAGGWRHGHNNHYGHYNYGYNHYYRPRHYGCFYKKVWRSDYYGYGYWKKIRICR